MKKILIVGAGLTGAVLAHELAEAGSCRIDVVDSRSHVGGNCHTERCPQTGIMQHVYGPHIFHTSNSDTWHYVNKFARFHPYVNKVMAATAKGVFSMPINLLTINQFFGRSMRPDEAKEFIASQCLRYDHPPANFEEQALASIGADLYENFFRSYTIKQWGCQPSELSADIFKRIPIRFTYDDNYFNDRYQGIPIDGYTEMMKRMLDHKQVTVILNKPFDHREIDQYDHTIFSGAIDEFFGYEFGRLGYRTVSFTKHTAQGTYQGTAVMNFCDARPYTRIHEHKYFAPWEAHEETVYFTEYSKETGDRDIPFYPKRLSGDIEIFSKYEERARRLFPHVVFAGRLGRYRYLSMHEVVESAIALARSINGYTRTA